MRKDRLATLLDRFGIEGIDNYRELKYVVLTHGIKENDWVQMDSMDEVNRFIAALLTSVWGIIGWYDLDEETPGRHGGIVTVEVAIGEEISKHEQVF